MNSNMRFPYFDTVRTILLVVFVFFVSVIVDITIFGVALTVVLFYAFWYYYRKSKDLQRRLTDTGASKPESQKAAPDDIPPPLSTDA
jgi:uncharacterized membrane protein